MAGFRNVREYVDAADSGRYHITTFRKSVASIATVANDFIDYSYFSGNPPANFYASAPLEAAHVESVRGIHLASVGDQFVKSVTLMSAAQNATTTTNQNQRVVLCDYLLYYPFIDTDAIGEQQDTIQTVSLPRYASGEGVMLMAVAQSSASTNGEFTVNYTNSDGVSGQISPPCFTKAVVGGGVLATCQRPFGVGSQMFIDLKAGDRGVRSVESVTFTTGGGGLIALVLVKPLIHQQITQECRRTTTGNLESYGAATQLESLTHRPAVKLEAGAVLGFVSLGNAGTLGSSILTGVLETQWGA